MKTSLLDLLVLLNAAENCEAVKRYIEACKDERLGWLSKADIAKRREAAEKSIAELEKKFQAMLG